MDNVLKIIDAAKHSIIFGDKSSPLGGHLTLRQSPDADANFCLVLGANASGKSVLRSVITRVCREADVECIHLSMAGRTTSGPIRAFVYGSEGDESTGACSAYTVATAIQTSAVRCSDSQSHVLFFDEPDIGMSDDLAAGSAIRLTEHFASKPKDMVASFIVTHRKAMIDYMVRGPVRPHFLWVGAPKSAPASVEAWLSRPIEPVFPEDVATQSRELYYKIAKHQDKHKKTGQ